MISQSSLELFMLQLAVGCLSKNEFNACASPLTVCAFCVHEIYCNQRCNAFLLISCLLRNSVMKKIHLMLNLAQYCREESGS